MHRIFTVLGTVCLVLFATYYSEGQDAVDVQRIQRATVYILQASSTDLTITCVGSGTIVSYDGLILTNAHHTTSSPSCPGTILFIALALSVDEAPVPKYRAEVVQADLGLDLALLKITREFDGRLIEPGSLPVLPFVQLGDTASLAIDQTVTIVGYPSIGNDPSLVTRGVVSGFLAEPVGGERAWIKVNTIDPAPGTMSGGGAYDRNGRLVGIPTGALVNTGNCALLEDTNRDNLINNNDRCVPLGDFISVLRPVDLALPLIRAASLGLIVEPITAPRFTPGSVAAPSIRRPFFSPSVVDRIPSSVASSMPAGTNSLYLFFDFSNMTADTVYELRVTIDGLPSPAFSLPSVRWSGGINGLWYIGSSGQPYPNGVYEYRIFVNGLAVASASIVIGGPPDNAPAFSNVLFGLLDSSGNLQGNGYVLPTGSIATARFVYRNMAPETPWTQIWFFNEQEIARANAVWSAADGSDGLYSINLAPQGGLLPGNYRVDLYINQNLSAMGDFVIAGAQENALPRIFTNAEFRRADTAQSTPSTTPSSTFPDGANVVFATFNWEQLAPGTVWTMQWSVDNQIFYRQVVPWSSPETGNAFSVVITAPGRLPDATYKLDLLVNNVLQLSRSFTVGIGQLAIDQLAEAGGIQLRGQIIDAETGRGISGATFLLISEDFSIADFTWSSEQLYALAVTDRDGRFEVDRPLRLDSPYSVLIQVQGYLPIARDGFRITPTILEEAGGNPLEMLIPLTRD